MIEMLDQYELRARIAPSLLVVFPLAVPLLMVPDLSSPSWMGTTLLTLVGLVIAYLLSFVVRHMGRRQERALWESWGGAPSTQLLMGNDKTLSPRTRQSIRDRVNKDLGVTIIPDSQDERQNVEDAFSLVRQRIRQLDPKGIWYKHNAEYGFLRNLWGSFWLWISIAAGSFVATVAVCAVSFSTTRLLLAIASLAVLVAIALLHTRVLRDPLRTAAFRYAESAWLSYLNIDR